jgi:hypothetical protein
MSNPIKQHTTGSRRGARQLACALTLTVIALLLTLSANASADSIVCATGSGTGQCEEPVGVAVDRSNGRVYVADLRNNRIDVFDSSGSFLLAFGWGVADGGTAALQSCGPAATPPTVSCFKGLPGSGLGQFDKPRRVAVDNNLASPAFHDVYVTDSNLRVQRFSPTGAFVSKFGEGKINRGGDPIAVGPGGNVYVGESQGQPRIEIFSPAGASIGASKLSSPNSVSDLAVDSSGDAYVMNGQIEKYELTEPEATKLNEIGALTNIRAIAVDQDDNLFVAHDEGIYWIVTKLSPSGEILKRFAYDAIEFGFTGIAIGTGGEVFGSESWVGAPLLGNKVLSIPQPPPGPLPCCLQSAVGNTKTTINGRINPEGKSTTYHFEYVDQESFEKEGGFASPKTVKTTESASIGSDFSLHPFEAEIGCTNPEFPPQPSCLKPGTEYRFRLVATNADGSSEVEGEFETKPPFEILETFATEVGTTEGRLHAVVNPLGIATTGYFEYVDDAKYQASGFAEASKAPDVGNAQAPLSFGSGEAGDEVSTLISSLEPGVTYHYRVVVTDPFVSKAGPEHTLWTFPLTTAPANSCPNSIFRSGPASKLPDCRAYEMVSPVDKNGGDIKVLNSTLNYAARLEVSSTDGNRFAYSSVTAFGDAVSAPWTSEYLATRQEGEGWSTHAINPARESNSLALIPAFKWDAQYKLFSPDLSEGWLIHDSDPPLDECAPEGVLNLYRRDNTTNSYEALTIAKPTNVGTDGYELELQGVSADGDHAVFRANGKLTNKAATAGKPQVYMHDRGGEGGCGTLRLVSVLPDSSASTGISSLGTFEGLPGESRGSAVSNAVSADGSRVFWSTDGSAMYLRDMAVGKTVQIAASGLFKTASPDGSKVIYTAGKDLFEADADKALAGEPASTLIAEDARNVVATSEDLSRIYFISQQAIGGEGEAGKPNLYLREGGATTLVATLYGGDATLPGLGDLSDFIQQQGFALGNMNSISNGVRTTTDGSRLAFVSMGSPTGYDNTDAVDAEGRKALEVYLYDAETDELACVSCNPTGARPLGRTFKSFGSTKTRRVAARMPAGQNMLVTPRALTSDGNRLFFDSYDALLPRDTNGKGDVYEWMRASGQKDCDKAGAELYVPNSGGCLSLISSGLNPVDSELADISPDGTDVFIRTASSFLPQDPGLVDVYDARVNGGLPQPPPSPPACEGETCQGAPSPPNDPTPASAGFKGPTGVPSKPRCAKGKARRKGRCVAKKHKKQSKQSKRANDNRRAGR